MNLKKKFLEFLEIKDIKDGVKSKLDKIEERFSELKNGF